MIIKSHRASSVEIGGKRFFDDVLDWFSGLGSALAGTEAVAESNLLMT